MVSYDEFQKLEMKVARVESVEKVDGTDKLYKMTVDTGEKRTIVSGIADQYKPEELIGTDIVVLTNLDPRKIRGVESNGMLLAAEDSAGIVSLLVPVRKIAPGTKVH
jgi:methionyl-tRNA synthetase